MQLCPLAAPQRHAPTHAKYRCPDDKCMQHQRVDLEDLMEYIPYATYNINVSGVEATEITTSVTKRRGAICIVFLIILLIDVLILYTCTVHLL